MIPEFITDYAAPVVGWDIMKPLCPDHQAGGRA